MPETTAGKIASGELQLQTPTPDEQAFDTLSLSNKLNKAALETKHPSTIAAFVGQRRVDLPPDQAQKALAAGTIQLPRNQDLHVFKDGEYKVIPPDQANQHLADGWSLSSAQEHHAAELHQKVGGMLGTAVAGGAGFARGFSTVLGGGSISDELIGFSPEAQEFTEAAGKEHGLASTVGESLGMIAQARAMPGGGLAGLAERGVGAAAGTGLGGRILAQGAKAAIENAQLEHAHQVGEVALGAPPLTAEKYAAQELSALWQGAAFGAAGAGIVEGLGAGARKLAGGLSRTASPEAIDGLAEKSFGYKPQSSVGKALVNAQAALSGADAEGRDIIEKAGIQNMSREAKEIRRNVLNIAEVRDTANKQLTEDLGHFSKGTEGLTDELRGQLKRDKMRGLVESPLTKDDLQARALDALQGVRDDVNGMMADRVTYGHGGDLKAIDTQLQGFEKQMMRAAERGDQAEMYAVLDDTKREIGKWSQMFQRSSSAGKPLSMMQAKQVFAKLGDVERGGGIYEGLRTHLEDEAIWGRAGDAQKALNADWTRYIAAQKQLERQASVFSVVGETNFGKKVYGVDPEKMARYVGTLVDPSKDLAHQAMTEYIAASKNLASTIAAHFELPAAKAKGVAGLLESAARMEKTLPDIADKIAHANQVDALIKASAGSPASMVGGFAGHLVGGPIGAAIGGAIGGLANPGKNIMRLAQLEAIAQKFDGKVGGAISRFFNRSETSAAELGAKAGKAAGKSTRELYEQQSKRAQKLADPTVLAGQLAPHHERIQGVAPQTSANVGATAARVVGYLTQHMPQVEPADPLTGKGGVPAMSEMDAFNLRYEAATKPETVIDDLARGRVTVEQVEALRECWPAIYADVQTKVQQRLLEQSERGTPVNFQQRVSLGILLDLETDPSLTKPSMGHAMATFAVPEQPADHGGPGGGGKQGPSLRGKTTETPSQRLEREPGAI